MICKIIIIAGVFINPCFILELKPSKENQCIVVSMGTMYSNKVVIPETCEYVAMKINEGLK
jgi:hypothetical protein